MLHAREVAGQFSDNVSRWTAEALIALQEVRRVNSDQLFKYKCELYVVHFLSCKYIRYHSLLSMSMLYNYWLRQTQLPRLQKTILSTSLKIPTFVQSMQRELQSVCLFSLAYSVIWKLKFSLVGWLILYYYLKLVYAKQSC